MADFTGVADVSTGNDIISYILAQPTEIVDDKNAINIGNNNIYVSDHISTFPIEFDLVDDLSGLPDLLNPASQLFQDYSDAFCNDVSYASWLRDESFIIRWGGQGWDGTSEVSGTFSYESPKF